ncbi:MAG: transcription-repair coupling factor, partial [Clostridia bacterium]|nr:transcription-repair coupling factor [Clostridia bacterium]
HGQMNKQTLEDQIMAFYAGKYDVLIATTIIENGIDIPNANTLIVIDADMLGLFTLYQLKGRVGRSDRVAHAYFTYRQDKVMTDAAYKRLSALMEHAELGSGYQIAMRDLEIRGAGNVLGKEQHGHMDKIGYELYSKLLKEQLGEVTKDYEIELDCKLDAYIPDGYITAASVRLDTYKAIAACGDEAEEMRVKRSIGELFGPLPPQVDNLFLIARLKRDAKKAEAIKLVVGTAFAQLTIKDLNSFKDGGLTAALNAFKENAVLSFDVNPTITVTTGRGALENARKTGEFLSFAIANRQAVKN